MTTASVRPLYMLLHGWGFDAGFWDGVRARLPEGDALPLDCGYFNARHMPELPVDRPLIAVGHSLGSMLLLGRSDVVWTGFVAINGFARFSFADDYPGVRRRVIEQMLRRFDQDPATVLGEFRARCGADEPPPADLQADALRSGLLMLRDSDYREAAAALESPALLLAGGADPIVTAEMTDASAACFRQATVEWLPDGGHLLPRLAPGWCVGHLTAFAERLMGAKG
jgi:pimeloyl-[acyl-carrier protein] methyl ester esterase